MNINECIKHLSDVAHKDRIKLNCLTPCYKIITTLALEQHHETQEFRSTPSYKRISQRYYPSIKIFKQRVKLPKNILSFEYSSDMVLMPYSVVDHFHTMKNKLNEEF